MAHVRSWWRKWTRREGMGFSIKIGTILDLQKSASGRVLLAFQDEEETQRLLSIAEPGTTAAERTAMARTIAKVAAQGFAFMRSNQFSGLEAISFPVLDLRGRAIAALTVPYVKRLDNPTRMSPADAQAALASTVADLNVALGGMIGVLTAVGTSRQGSLTLRRRRLRLAACLLYVSND